MALRTERSQWQRSGSHSDNKGNGAQPLNGPKNGAEPMAKEGSHSDNKGNGAQPLNGPKNGEKPMAKEGSPFDGAQPIG